MTGCQSTTPVSVGPIKIDPPAELMVPPVSLETIPEGTSLKDALPVIVENNRKLVEDRQRLIWLQEWVLIVNDDSVKENLF